MFDFQKFDNAVGPASLDAATYTKSGVNQALLYVFSPVPIPTQVLRPYQYDFSENLIDTLANTKEPLRKVITENQKTYTKLAYDINSAIRPNTDGITLDTETVSRQWSFILVIDVVRMDTPDRMCVANPTVRTIATGYVTDEPVNVATRTPNPNAVLQFTKCTVTNIQPSYGYGGRLDRIGNQHDVDLFDSRVQQMVPMTTLLAPGTPKDLLKSVQIDYTDHSLINAIGAVGLSNVGENGDTTRTTDNSLKVPTAQFGDIVGTLNQAITTAKRRSNAANSSLIPRDARDSIDMARDEFRMSLPGSDTLMYQQGLDPTTAITMDQLIRMYPNLQIFPYQLPMTNIWDASPQNVQDRRNAMSSMLSAALSSLLPASGLTEISFRYDSYVRNSPYGSSDPNGIFMPVSYSTLINCSPEQQVNAVEEFKTLFIERVVPIVKTYNGEFSLFARIDMCGHILIDLHYEDMSGYNPGEGWYETSGRLGGYLNPMIADQRTFNTNATQLIGLCDVVMSKNLSYGQVPDYDIGPASYQNLDYAIEPATADYQFTPAESPTPPPAPSAPAPVSNPSDWQSSAAARTNIADLI